MRTLAYCPMFKERAMHEYSVLCLVGLKCCTARNHLHSDRLRHPESDSGKLTFEFGVVDCFGGHCSQNMALELPEELS